MTDRNVIGQFVNGHKAKANRGSFTCGNPPPQHRQNCGCFRCAHVSPMMGKKNPIAAKNPQVFKKGMIPWNKGRNDYMTKELRARCGMKNTGRPSSRKGKKYPQYSGERHPNWKGTTPEYKRIRNSSDYKWWRTAVFERDNFTCVECGARNGGGKTIRLEADHIKPFAFFPKLRFHIANGRTLCVDCHKQTSTYGHRAATHAIISV